MIKFYENRKWFFIISLALFVIGIAFIFINGVHMDIQFTGGTKITYNFSGTLDVDAARADIQTVTKRVVSTQKSTGSTDGSSALIVSLSGRESLSTEELEAIDTVVLEKFKDNSIARASTTNVEPYIGARFLRKGITAIVLAIILITIFVTIRFKLISGFSAALTALIALFHDVLIVFFVFVVAGIPLNDGFIAVVLTILGYSVNDTLVIYDRIRENKRMYGDKLSTPELVNKSLNQSMRRCINTSVLTFTAMFLVFLFALINNISSVVNFALPLMVGILSGTYSSLCIAPTIWVSLKGKGKKA